MRNRVNSYWEGKKWILGNEKHRASEQFRVELLTGLDLVQRNDNSLEEVNVFLSEWNGESGNDGGEDVQQFWGTIELEVLMDQGVEAISDGLSDHLSSWNKLGVESVQDVLQVLSFLWLFGVEQLKELLDELVSNESLQALDIGGIVDDELEEEFVDWLEMWPTWVDNDLFFFDTQLVWSALLDDWKWSENVLLDHFHDSVKMWDDQIDHMVLVGEEVTQLGNVLQSLVLLSDHLVVIIEIEVLGAELDFFQEKFLAFYSLLDSIFRWFFPPLKSQKLVISLEKLAKSYPWFCLSHL